MKDYSNINEGSKIPKYRQIINNIIAEIHKGNLKKGQKIPSINETSFEYYLSRDTVEKAYNELRRRGIIISVRGKGFYVNDTVGIDKLKILLIFNKISAYKKIIYNNIVKTLGENAVIDLKIHNYDAVTFENFIDGGLDYYNYVMVMPHFDESEERIQNLLKKIPKEKLILLDKKIENFDGANGCVYQDFQNDIYDALGKAMDLLKKYEHFYLIFPEEENEYYCEEISWGFRNFCLHKKLNFKILHDLPEGEISKGDVFVLIRETDLVGLIKKARDQKLIPGKDLGLISYNETPMKEVLCDGISVITTDFEKMGKAAAKMILNKEFSTIRNEFLFIQRNTL
ncbi:winged helix-turn-helix domain-containing protein [Flexithrix dorotheae]|uniref:GntR family transcriptional regulator n=1 Tax=Flexithrix dorotheae TaxID=70993 RepID=UPI00035F10EA|nr:winged helix-turn-helix domain-containing protein [Flexithrix dorotheae]